MKNKTATIALVLGLCILLPTQGSAGYASLVPLPVQVIPLQGSYTLKSSTGVFAAEPLARSKGEVRMLLGSATGFDFPATDEQNAGIRIHYSAERTGEAYRLQTGADGITITAASAAGAFYALQTLRQLLPPAIYSPHPVAADWTVPAIVVEDAPRFRWRGLHLDVGRHFMPVAFIKKYIDVLAAHKMNTFHWHLTEDQGWRIEIERYPRLTEVGSKRAQTIIGHQSSQKEEDWQFDGTPHGGFYTREEVREVVAYAARRHVTVVPEIEFPGHAQAAIAAYPELGNTGRQLQVWQRWGINENTLKPSEETLQFYRNVLDEVLALFPSEYIHIGGDEVPKVQWQESEYAQQRIRELGLADEFELQSWLIGQIDEYLSARGRKMVGWDEIMQGGLSENATVMSWRGTERGLEAAAQGHEVIMAPVSWTYFDFYQAHPSNEPLAIGEYLPLRRVYAFDPAPASLPAPVRANIIGAQGQVWTEYIKTPDHVEYMAYPRATALAEVLWSPQETRDYTSFLQRLPGHLERLDTLEVNYRPPGNDELGLWDGIKAWLRQVGTRVYYRWYLD